MFNQQNNQPLLGEIQMAQTQPSISSQNSFPSQYSKDSNEVIPERLLRDKNQIESLGQDEPVSSFNFDALDAPLRALDHHLSLTSTQTPVLMSNYVHSLVKKIDGQDFRLEVYSYAPPFYKGDRLANVKDLDLKCHETEFMTVPDDNSSESPKMQTQIKISGFDSADENEAQQVKTDSQTASATDEKASVFELDFVDALQQPNDSSLKIFHQDKCEHAILAFRPTGSLDNKDLDVRFQVTVPSPFWMLDQQQNKGKFLFRSHDNKVFFLFEEGDSYKIGILREDLQINQKSIQNNLELNQVFEIIKVPQSLKPVLQQYREVAEKRCWVAPNLVTIRDRHVLVLTFEYDDRNPDSPDDTKVQFYDLSQQDAASSANSYLVYEKKQQLLFCGFSKGKALFLNNKKRVTLVQEPSICKDFQSKDEDVFREEAKGMLQKKYLTFQLKDLEEQGHSSGFIEVQQYYNKDTKQDDNLMIQINSQSISFVYKKAKDEYTVDEKSKLTLWFVQIGATRTDQKVELKAPAKYNDELILAVSKKPKEQATLSLNYDFKSTKLENFKLLDPWFDQDLKTISGIIKFYTINSETPTFLTFCCSVDGEIREKRNIWNFSKVQTQCLISNTSFLKQGQWISYVGPSPDRKLIMLADLNTNKQTGFFLKDLTFVEWVQTGSDATPAFLAYKSTPEAKTLYYCSFDFDICEKLTAIEVRAEFDINKIKCAFESFDRLIVQTEDNIYSCSKQGREANAYFQQLEVLCEPGTMVKCFVVTYGLLTYYYLKRKDDVTQLMELHSREPEVVFEHKGPKICTLQADGENAVLKKGLIEFRFLLMDQDCKIYKVHINHKGEKSGPEIEKIYTRIKENHPNLTFGQVPWLHSRIDSQTITVGSKTYDLETTDHANVIVCEKQAQKYEFMSQIPVLTQSQLPMTIIKRDLTVFFRLKHSPGSHQITFQTKSRVVGCKTIQTFVSNNHVLIEIKEDKYKRYAVYSLQSGYEVEQEPKIKMMLSNCRLMFQSRLENDSKDILFEKDSDVKGILGNSILSKSNVFAQKSHSRSMKDMRPNIGIRTRKIIRFDKNGKGKEVKIDCIQEKTLQTMSLEKVVGTKEKCIQCFFLNNDKLFRHFKIKTDALPSLVKAQSSSPRLRRPDSYIMPDISVEYYLTELYVPQNTFDKLEKGEIMLLGNTLVCWQQDSTEVLFKDIESDEKFQSIVFKEPLDRQNVISLSVQQIPQYSALIQPFRINNKKEVRKNLIQVNLQESVVIYDLDQKQEVKLIENVSKYRNLKLQNYYDYGFVTENLEGNEFNTYLYDKFQQEESEYITVSTPVCEWTLVKLVQLAREIKAHKRPSNINLDLVQSDFYGHTFFSIFGDHTQIMMLLRDIILRVNDPDLKRRMLQVMTRPTLAYSDSDDENNTKVFNYRSVLEKSVYNTNNLVFNTLAQIAAQCSEITFNLFVRSTEDLNELMKKHSLETINLMNNCSIKTDYTEQLIEACIDGSKPAQVFSGDTFQFDEEIANAARNTQKWPVTVKQVDVNWILRSDNSWKSLIQILSDAPEEVFQTQLVKVLSLHFWDECKRQLGYKLFSVFVFSLAIYNYYALVLLVSKFDFTGGNYIMMNFFRFYLLIWAAFNGWIELKQMISEKLQYLEFWNMVDCATIGLTMIIIIPYEVWPLNYDPQRIPQQGVNLIAISVFLWWLKLFYWLRLFERTSFYVRLIRQTIGDMRAFLALVAIITMAFACSAIVLNSTDYYVFASQDELLKKGFKTEECTNNDLGEWECDKGFVDDSFESAFFDPLLFVYLLGLTMFEPNDEGYGINQTCTWIIIIFGAFIINVVFFNMLIAIMTNTYEISIKNEAKLSRKEQINLISSYVSIPNLNILCQPTLVHGQLFLVEKISEHMMNDETQRVGILGDIERISDDLKKQIKVLNTKIEDMQLHQEQSIKSLQEQQLKQFEFQQNQNLNFQIMLEQQQKQQDLIQRNINEKLSLLLNQLQQQPESQ